MTNNGRDAPNALVRRDDSEIRSKRSRLSCSASPNSNCSDLPPAGRQNEHQSVNRYNYTVPPTGKNHISKTSQGTSSAAPLILWWNSPQSYVPLQAEEAMIDTLLKYAQRERGMIKDLPPYRVHKIRKRCQAVGMTLAQALSLRRHHMKLHNPYLTMYQLRLGREEDINESARIFEQVVEDYLTSREIVFLTEEQQKADFQTKVKATMSSEKPPPTPSTPDFLLTTEVVVRKTRGYGKKQRILEEQKINWIEAKMFYGASTIPDGTKGAVGNLLRTARKYFAEYGPGAMVFMYGCGKDLAEKLRQEGVLVLDCSGTVNLEPVHDHQRTWCANGNGQILP